MNWFHRVFPGGPSGNQASSFHQTCVSALVGWKQCARMHYTVFFIYLFHLWKDREGGKKLVCSGACTPHRGQRSYCAMTNRSVPNVFVVCVWQMRRKSVSAYSRRAFAGRARCASGKCFKSGNFPSVFGATLHTPCCDNRKIKGRHAKWEKRIVNNSVIRETYEITL